MRRPALRILLDLLKLPRETEWVEFKVNNEVPEAIGEYISALSNGAALHGKPEGYIVWGVDNDTHHVKGTAFRPRQRKVGNEELESWLLHLLNPRIDFMVEEFQHSGADVVMFVIQAANTTPVRFKNEAYVRVGSYKKKLREYPEKERKLWRLLSSANTDWSAKVVGDATVADLDEDAIAFARQQYLEKHALRRSEAEEWDNVTFLNKAKICVEGNVTRAALLLLGKEESSHYLSPAQAKTTWVLRDKSDKEVDYRHIEPPLIFAGRNLLPLIRNLTIRHMPSGELFPHEVQQYDNWVIRETLHNCIAHQDYSLGGRINVVETPNGLLFSNLGAFIPGTVEEMIRRDAPPEVYRNPFLAQAMVNLNMIDTIGSGIKRMFLRQRERNFPMPDYNLSDNRVVVQLSGRVLDENYTKLLLLETELDLMDVIALDKVQKKHPLTEDEFKRLKARRLIEGRRPNIFVSAAVAAATDDKAQYIKNRGFDKAHYSHMVIDYLKQFGEATRQDIDKLLLDKISDALSAEQKKKHVTNLLQEMRQRGVIYPEGTTRWAKWRMSKSGS